VVDTKNLKKADLWYVIGLIVTDGNLSSSGRHINITSKDGSHLVIIKKVLGLGNKIGWKARGGSTEKKYSFLQFGDKKFYQYLCKIGLSPKKSLILEEIAVNQRYFRDFLRGVIDGDGCISTWIHRGNGHRQWSLRIVSGAKIFSHWLKKEVEDFFGVQGRLYVRREKGRKNPLYLLKFGKLAAKVILEKTYYQGSLSLNRKFLKTKICLQDANRMVNYGKVLSPGAVTG
jgi:hypothetical protein